MNYIPEIVKAAKNIHEHSSSSQKAIAQIAAVIVNLSESSVKPEIVDSYISENIKIAKANIPNIHNLKGNKLFDDKLEESINFLIFKNKNALTLKEWHNHFLNVKNHLTSYYTRLDENGRKIEEKANNLSEFQKVLLESALRNGVSGAYETGKTTLLEMIDATLSQVNEQEEPNLKVKCALLEFKIDLLGAKGEITDEDVESLNEGFEAVKTIQEHL